MQKEPSARQDVPEFTETLLTEHVHRLFGAFDYAVLDQVPIGAIQGGIPRTRIIDVLAIGPGDHKVAVEIKVTRPDLLSDIADPEKQAPWIEATDQHYYAFPEGIAKPHEVPPTSGALLLCQNGSGDWHLTIAKEAPKNGNSPASAGTKHFQLVLEAARRYEQRAGWRAEPDEAARLANRLDQAQFRIAQLESQAQAEFVANLQSAVRELKKENVRLSKLPTVAGGVSPRQLEALAKMAAYVQFSWRCARCDDAVRMDWDRESGKNPKFAHVNGGFDCTKIEPAVRGRPHGTFMVDPTELDNLRRLAAAAVSRCACSACGGPLVLRIGERRDGTAADAELAHAEKDTRCSKASLDHAVSKNPPAAQLATGTEAGLW